ncbi:MAG: TlyA family RNA methyltransferase [Candidatus Atribacteria bacterium]|nr:TlyA family RNA methyltransferase [Candidatus Atribacteria bacterium]
MEEKRQKIRIDELLVKRGFVESREKAQRMILAGNVKVEKTSGILKPSTKVHDDTQIVLEKLPQYVSRGGEKLAKALSFFHINPIGLVFLDIGASTGGFTDCLLQNHAKKVFALDVGYGLLHEKLRMNPKVFPLERRNIRYFSPKDLPEPIQGITVDVSFISLRLIFPVIDSLLPENGIGIALIKPQFEAGRDKVESGGLVRKKATHIQVLKDVLESARDNHLQLQGLTFSPIQGGEGNIEYLAYWRKWTHFFDKTEFGDIIRKEVQEAHRFFLIKMNEQKNNCEK